jgi:hypothetical protein
MIDNKFKGNRNSFISLPRYLLKGSKATCLYNINDRSAIPKNMSITRFREVVSSGGYIDVTLSDLIVKVFSTMYKSSKFILEEEPLLSTYTCRFSRANLSFNYHTLEVAHYAYIKEVNKITKEAFKEHRSPLELPCSYYVQGPFKLVNPKLYRFSSFKTRHDQIKHVF